MTCDVQDDALSRDLRETAAKAKAQPDRAGMFSIKTANETIREAALRPDPVPLWLTLWYEGECCCLFADSNLGKSIYAVQIATQIAKSMKVLYFDFELSDKQFQLRYTDDDTKKQFGFPPDFLRAEIEPDAIETDMPFEDAVNRDIETAIIAQQVKIIIIDNLTYLAAESEKGDVAAALMMRLIQLKRKHGLSMLVIAHTPKRPLSNPITQNDLAGSKKLYNFFDSVFAIGRSAIDTNLRYIKQLKVRYGDYTYDQDNVIVYQIEKINSFLQFSFVGYATEREHLKEQTDGDRSQIEEAIRELEASGKSYRQIAEKLGVSLGKVQRVLKKN